MKKLFLFVALVTFSLTAQAQFSLGANFGLPTGDAEPVTTFAISAEANYMFESDSDLSFGLSASYLTFLGDDPFPDWSFLPLAGAVRYPISDSFSLGADIGYAIGLDPTGNDGGFYYRPVLGYSLGESTTLNLSYSSISVNGATISNFGLGIMFGL